jgi:hypothetical protein
MYLISALFPETVSELQERRSPVKSSIKKQNISRSQGLRHLANMQLPTKEFTIAAVQG